MTEAIIVAIITGGFAFAGAIVAAKASSKKSDAAFQTSQAVMNAKIDELTREVREHNNFARRMPVVEQKLEDITRRVGNLERERGA